MAAAGGSLLGRLAGSGGLDLAGARLVAGTPFPHVITRAGWGADESIRQGTQEFARLEKIVIHHTVTTNAETDPAERIRAIYKHHVEARGFQDIGYHFVIDRDGRIYEGRFARDYGGGPHTGQNADGHLVTGAHASGHNRGVLGVAFLGTYTGERPPEPALEAAAKLIAFYADRHGLDPFDVSGYVNSSGATVQLPNIFGHRDVVSTSCPGDALYGAIQDIRGRVAQTIGRGFIGYRIVSSTGEAAHFGGARDYGDLRQVRVQTRVVGAAGVPDAQGYWMVDPSGAVYSFGAAGFFGSLPGLRQQGRRIGGAPIIGISPSATGNGYWLFDDLGGIFSFGDAAFHGSVPGLREQGIPVGPARIVTMLATPTGNGYWVVDEFGGIFAFGDARWFGSLPDLRNRGHRIGPARIVSMAATPTGNGYWLADQFGGVFAFGDAGFHGSVPALGIRDIPARRIVASPSGGGYLIATASGAVYTFGDAPFHGRWATPLDVVDLAPVIRRR